MRARAGFIAVVGLAVAIVACGDNATTGKTTTTSTTSVPTTTVSTARLDAMRLDEGDIEAGWQIGPDLNAADFSDATQIPCDDVATNPTITKRLTPVTGIQFEPTDGSYKHLIEFLVTGEPGQLDSDLQAYVAAMESCSTGTPTAAGTVERFTIPELGDQRAAYVITGTESPDATWHVRTATVRVGSVAVEIGLTEILSTPQGKPTISDADFVHLLQAAVAKIGG